MTISTDTHELELDTPAVDGDDRVNDPDDPPDPVEP